MSNFFCPECGYEGDDPLCPHCNIPTEKLDVDDDIAGENEETYPEEAVKKVDSDDDGKIAKDSLDEDIEDGLEEEV